LGELAAESGMTIDMIVVGGAAMSLAYKARQSTRDVDAIIISPERAASLRDLANRVATEMRWPTDWLNDAAKGYLHGFAPGDVLHQSRGITVRAPAAQQLLAMKLCAWRDDVDIEDARKLLGHLRKRFRTRGKIWPVVEPWLLPGRELKASYAFEDLWEAFENGKDND
jgi:hypothetical protein